MARMVPSTISRDRPHSERVVHQALSGLPDDWTVFYSTGWQSERRGRPGDGEADFVLLHRRGLLVLEVKGGTVRIVDGEWESISAGGQAHRIRDPFQQALDSRKALQRYLRERLQGSPWLDTGHGVCFPDSRITGDLGPEGPRSIVWDRDDLRDIGRATETLVEHWGLASTVCFNRPLGQYLAQQFDGMSPIRATSFHVLCRELALRAGELLPQRPSQTWWDEVLPAATPDYAKRVGFDCSAIVVDEGQDFMPDWWLTLELLLKEPEEDPFYVFVDTAQQIYRPGWQPPFTGPAADLTINCRNTMEIAKRVAGVFGGDIPTLGASGPDPTFLIVKSPEQIEAKLHLLLAKYLIKGGLRPDQVVVLSTSRPEVDRLRGREFAGFGLVAPGEDGVVTETVHRFKGLEADAVILLLPSLYWDEDRVLAYIGMSRARAQLAVLGPPEVRAAMAW